MKIINTFVSKVNEYQKNHTFFSFIVAVIMKYSDDSTGRQAALLTYYSFLSLFPLLMILTTLADILVGGNKHLHDTIIHGLTDYFPLLGNQLSESVGRLHASGVAVLAGVLFTLYGTRGVANVFRSSVRDIWYVTKKRRHGFAGSLLKSMIFVVVAGIGFITASILAGLASSSGHGAGFRILSLSINIIILFGLFNFLINYSLPKQVTFKDIWLGALIAAVFLVILQSLGGFILAKELKKLDSLYSYFAVALGLLFWLYLQTQIVFYALQAAAVKAKHLWPRSLDASSPTNADRLMKAYER